MQEVLPLNKHLVESSASALSSDVLLLKNHLTVNEARCCLMFVSEIIETSMTALFWGACMKQYCEPFQTS